MNSSIELKGSLESDGDVIDSTDDLTSIKSSVASSNPTLLDLAGKITSCATAMTEYMVAHGHNLPSFANDGVADYPRSRELAGLQDELLGATIDLLHLAAGHAQFFRIVGVTGKTDVMVLGVLDLLDVYSAVPLNGFATYSEIAARTRIPEDMLRRVLRHAMTLHVFSETVLGSELITHSAISAARARNPQWAHLHGMAYGESARASTFLVDAIQKYGGQPEPGWAAVALAFFPDAPKEKTYFEWASEEGNGPDRGWRLLRLSRAMDSLSKSPHMSLASVHTALDWDELGEATVIDVGGGVGHASFELAQVHPKLRCVVQDFASLQIPFEEALPSELTGRVTFQAHDFFTEQPIRGAAVYFLRHVLHDWPDKYAKRIILNLVPAMRPRSRLVLMDRVMAPRGSLPSIVERFMTTMDLEMMIMHNARERSHDEWIELVTSVDRRFRLERVGEAPLAGTAQVMEFVFWDSDP